MGKKTKKEKQSTSLTVHLPSTTPHPDNPYPIVSYFPSGFDSSSAPPPHQTRLLRHDRHPKRLQLVLTPDESSSVDFVGTNFSGEGAAPQVCTFILGVVDRDAGTLTFAPLPANKIFRLEPKIGGSDVSEMESSKGELTAENKPEKMKVEDTYSSKKVVARARKLEAIYRNEDTDHQEDFDKNAEEIKKNQEAIASAGAVHTRNIPPYDDSTTTKEMVYPLNKIILGGEWDFLMDILELFDAEQDLASEDYPSFVRNRVHLLGQKQDEERKKLACIFSYITHLIKFKDKHSIDGFSSAKYHRLPSIIHQKFSTMFTPSENKRLPEDKKNLLISYALVLTLFVDDFDTNPSDIAKDLRMNDLKVRSYFEHLGCKKHIRQGNLKFELRAPLEFPKTRLKRRR